MSVGLRCTGLPRILRNVDWLPVPETVVMSPKSSLRNRVSEIRHHQRSGSEAERGRVFFLAHRPDFDMCKA